MKRLRKLTSIIAICALVFAPFIQVVNPPAVYAAPQRPGTPDLPEEPEEPSLPDRPDEPARPGDTSADTAPNPEGTSEAQTSDSQTDPTESPSPEPTSTTTTGSTTESDNHGDTSIATGNANAVGTINTQANTNVSSGNVGADSGGTTATNLDNGQNSTNTNTIDNQSTVALDQNNSATVKNTGSVIAISGDNQATDNIGGDVSIESGDANTALTAATFANTNIAGTDIVEFNVIDDHVGDIILDFASPCSSGGCVAGTPLYLANSGNGQDSTNTNSVTTDANTATFQASDATIENNLILDSNSGDNRASDNIGGDVAIVTGDANVSANVLNFANNNFAGNVLVGIVNIFGDLIGDIILPEQEGSGTGAGTYVTNTDNGSGSQNVNTVDQSTLDQINQTNTATIDNNLNLSADTGSNYTNDNIKGGTSITTGDANVVAQVLNLANTNIVGGNWWVVLVNEAGNWIGHIVGGSEGANYAGSAGTQFIVNPDGSITAYNQSSGADEIIGSPNGTTYNGENLEGSTNTNNLTSSTTNTTTQNNNATIVNNLDLSANTGGNKANDNGGGTSSITTGDANVVASVVNFLNNNFVGGRVYLTVVNVFGSWLGDFVGPGQTQELASASSEVLALGGPASDTDSNSTHTSSGQGGSGSPATVQAALATADVPTPQSGTLSSNTTGNFLAFNATAEAAGEPAVEGAAATAKKVVKVNLALVIPAVIAYILLRYNKQLAALLPKKRK